MFGRIKSYVNELRQEFKRINWPSRGETAQMSVVVVVISLLVAAFLGALDFIFVTILEKIVV